MPDHNKVQSIMHDKGITRDEFASRMGLEPENTYRLTDRDANCLEDTILKMCRALVCTPNDIMRDWEA